MKKLLPAVLVALVAALASGCVIAPPRPVAVYDTAPVYVAPVYASPGVGWVWAPHPSYGWGWRHSHHGWHRGWR